MYPFAVWEVAYADRCFVGSLVLGVEGCAWGSLGARLLQALDCRIAVRFLVG